jgi:hypothetical protein
MIYLGQLNTQDGAHYRALLVTPERIELSDDSERGRASDEADGPLTLELTDLKRERAPWEGSALRVHRGDVFFALDVLDPELERLRQSYAAANSKLRLRPSALVNAAQ